MDTALAQTILDHLTPHDMQYADVRIMEIDSESITIKNDAPEAIGRTTSIGFGKENSVKILQELQFPHSLGMLYSAFTYYTGFRVNSGEYKVMGLAPYGEGKYVQTILDNLIDIKQDGSFHLNLEYFNFPVGLTMTNRKFNRLFGGVMDLHLAFQITVSSNFKEGHIERS